MMERFALWLEAHCGLVLAAIVITVAALCIYAGHWLLAFAIVVIAALGLGAAWDQDTYPDRENG